MPKTKIEHSDEKLERVGAVIYQFAGRKFYPTRDEGFDALVKAVAKIVWDKDEGHRHDWPEEKFQELKVAKIGNDLDWLGEQAFERFRTCPTPRDFRAIYCAQGLMPLDGRAINEEVEE